MREKNPNKYVCIWLILCCSLIFLMIIIGGITRLTDSGLSMVEWRPLTGILPPLNNHDWNEVFAQYQKSPEFRLLNPEMSIQEFKPIFWMEYLHRMWGRMLAVIYLLPLIFFIATKKIQRTIRPHLLMIFLLGFFQGLLGWFMVKSGLVDRPDVSHYRLVAHLMLAIFIYSYLFWIFLKIYMPNDRKVVSKKTILIKKLSTIMLVLILTTLASGGLVAGLDAGSIYNTFPLMGDRLIPREVITLEPWFINFGENAATVQLQHRMLAIITGVFIIFLWIKTKSTNTTNSINLAINCLVAMTGIQITLGITTLILSSPIIFASLHQANSIIVLTLAIWLKHETEKLRIS